MPRRLQIPLRPLGLPEIAVLGRYDYSEAMTGLEMHAHANMLEICYLARGRQIYRVGERDFSLKGGDLFLTFPGEAHSTGETPQEKGTLYWMQILLPRKNTRFLHLPPEDSRAMIRALLGIAHRHFKGMPGLRDRLESIITLAPQKKAPLQRVRLRHHILDFLLLVIECSRDLPRENLSSSMSQLMHYIETNAHQSLPVPVLAARVGLSVPRFKARFKQEAGIPPAEFVLRCKIDRAKKMLASPQSSVTRTAMDLNFPSSQYFATVFRRYVGQTPSRFRHQQLSVRDSGA
ncbi:MAG: AraC family transcriptional regulator [Verrucomicrobiae bacterium]|nr:AraC family transcriptional regulator [Verrucomicrobiae bacterium]